MTAVDTLHALGLLQSVGHAVIATDVDGVVRFWNHAATDLYGWTSDEAVGRAIVELIDPSPSAAPGERRIGRIAAGERIREEYLVRHRDGHRFPVDVAGTPWVAEDGTVVGVVGVSVCLSEQHRLATYLDAFGDLTGVGRWEVDLATATVRLDRRAAELLALAEDEVEVSVDEWYRQVHPDDRPAMHALADAVRANESVPDLAFRTVTPDGSTRHLIGRGVVLERVGDAPRRAGGVLLDVTETERVTRTAAEALDNLTDGYFTLDRELRITFVNRAAEAVAGLSRHDVVGRRVGEAMPEAARFEPMYEAVLASGGTLEYETYFEPLDLWLRARVVAHDDGLAVTFHDCTEAHRLAEERDRAATHDALTGLGNRYAVERWLAGQLAGPNPRIAVFQLDLDRFTNVNDSLGHGAGDALLREIAARLTALDVDGVVARVGGDEFVVAARLEEPADGRRLVADLLAAVRQPVVIAGRRLVVTTSIGVAHTGMRHAELTPEGLLRDADAAVYRAKQGGGDRALSFGEEMHTQAVRRMELEAELRRALQNDELKVVYQPSFDLRTGECTGAEALVRWHHPERGIVPPSEFIPIAEDTGLIVPLGDRVLDIVARHLRGRQPHPNEPRFTVWVNVSAQQLADPAFFDRVAAEPCFLGGRLGLEVTETMLLEDYAMAAAALEALVDAGVRVAIDDFGTGYSSLARLPRYPFDLLKIDQSFIRNLDDAPFRAMVAATVQLGHGLQKRVIAEGVETAAQLLQLRRLGCDEVSGFHLARPVPPAELVDAIRDGIALLAGGTGGTGGARR